MSISISLDKKQARQLVKALFIADWVYNSARPDEETLPEIFMLQQEIYHQLALKGNRDVSPDPENKMVLVPNGQVGDEAEEIMDYFSDMKFVVDLSSKLATRDLEEKYPDLDFDEPENFDDLEDEFHDINQKYLPDLIENGVKNLRWVPLKPVN